MRRTRAILLGWFLVALALPPAAWATITTTPGTDGPATAGSVQKDAATISAAHPAGQARCKESANGATITWPSGNTTRADNCATVNMTTATDIIPAATTGTVGVCQLGTGAGNCAAGNDSRFGALPPPYYTATGNLTGTGTGTATASTTATSTSTIAATATVTGTGTAAGTGTVTGTFTFTATGYATLTKTATGTVTATVTGTGTGTSTTTEVNASIGNASAAPAMFSIGTSGQTQFDPSGNEVSSGTINLTGIGKMLAAGTAGTSIILSRGANQTFLGFNAILNGTTFQFGPGSANQYAAGIRFSPGSGQVDLGVVHGPGYEGQTAFFQPSFSFNYGTVYSAAPFGASNIGTTPTANFIPQAYGTGLLDPLWIPPVTQLASSTGSVTVNTSAPTAATQACVTTGSGATASCTWQSVLVGNGVSGASVEVCDYLNGQCTATHTGTTTGTVYAGAGATFTTGTGTATATSTSAALSGPFTINITGTATSTATATLAAGNGIGFRTNTTTSTFTSCTLPGACTIVQTSTATGTNTFAWSGAKVSSGANGLTTATAVLTATDISTAGGLVKNGLSGAINWPTALNFTDGQITGAAGGSQPITGPGTTGYFPYSSSTYGITGSTLQYSGGDLLLAGSFRPTYANVYALGSSSYPWINVYTQQLNLGGVNATSVGGTANAPVVADGSGTVNSWTTGMRIRQMRYLNTPGASGRNSVWTSVMSETHAVTPSNTLIMVQANIHVHTTPGVSCSARLSVNGVVIDQVRVDLTFGGGSVYGNLPLLGTASVNGSPGGTNNTVLVEITSSDTTVYCTTDSGSAPLVTTELAPEGAQ